MSEASDYLAALQYGHPGGGVGVNADRLDPEFSYRISALIQAAEKATGDKVQIFEGYRDPARSAQLNANYRQKDVTYGGKTYSPQPGVKGYKAAPPGVSEHNYGMATDIRAGKNPDKYPSGPAYDYMVKHAGEYGLQNLGASDPAHFQIAQDQFDAFRKGQPLPKLAAPNANFIPPMNIPQVATQLDVVPPKVKAPTPMPGRPAALRSDFSLMPPPIPLNLPVPAGAGDSWGPTANRWGPGNFANAFPSQPPTAPYVSEDHPRSNAAPKLPSVPPPLPRNSSIGMVAPGNIDINNRPVYFGSDGTYGTERSFSIGTDKGEVLIPQIVGGKLVSQQQAIDHYMKTGENLGTFASPDAADRFATQLHQRDQGLGKMPVPMPGRPLALNAPTIVPQAPQQAAPPPVPTQRPSAPPPAPVAQQVRLASGKMIAPGVYNQGDHNVQVSDDGTGHAKIDIVRGPMAIPGLIDPMREMNAPTLAGMLIRAKVPEVLAQGYAGVKDNIGSAVTGVQQTAADAVNGFGSNIQGFGSSIGNAFGGLFGQHPPPVSPWAPAGSFYFPPPRQQIVQAPVPRPRPLSLFSVAAPRNVSIPVVQQQSRNGQSQPQQQGSSQTYARAQQDLRDAGVLNSFGQMVHT